MQSLDVTTLARTRNYHVWKVTCRIGSAFMPTFKVAHIREQGIDLIIIPLDPTFGRKSSTDQLRVIRELQGRAASARIVANAAVGSTIGRSFQARRFLHTVQRENVIKNLKLVRMSRRTGVPTGVGI